VIDRRAFLLAPALALAQCRRRKSTGFLGYAFVANEEGQAIAAVDLTTFTVARHIRLEGNPTAVLAHPAAVYALTPNTGTVHEISVADLSLRRKIQVARSAVSMRLAPDLSALWVLCREPRRLVRLQLNPFRNQAQLNLAFDPVDFDLAPAGGWAAVSFGAAGALAFLDLAAARAERPVSLGQPLSSVRFRSDGKLLLAGNIGQRMLSILEAPTGRLIVHLPLAVRPDNFCFKSDGGQLFLTGEGMDAVVVAYPYSTEIAETVLAGKAPGAMAASNAFLFVANPPSGDVTILDIETRRAIAVVATGGGPGFITVTPDDQYALVLNPQSGSMAVIRVATIKATRTKSASLFTMIPVGSKPVSAVVRGV
jgi:YVTN family beta-propeller protein